MEENAAIHEMELDTDDEDVIVTIRHDTVIEKIQKFIAEHRLVPTVFQNIFTTIYLASCPLHPRVPPECLLFDEISVDTMLKKLDISNCPRVPEPPTDPVDIAEQVTKLNID